MNDESPEAFLHRRAPTVIVADDDVELRTALRIALSQHGCNVVEAPDGETALELVAKGVDEQRVPDALILDVRLPGFSGLGVLHTLRRLPRSPRVLLITGFRDQSIDIVARRFGAARVLHKPLELAAVLAALADVLA